MTEITEECAEYMLNIIEGLEAEANMALACNHTVSFHNANDVKTVCAEVRELRDRVRELEMRISTSHLSKEATVFQHRSGYWAIRSRNTLQNIGGFHNTREQAIVEANALGYVVS